MRVHIIYTIFIVTLMKNYPTSLNLLARNYVKMYFCFQGSNQTSLSFVCNNQLQRLLQLLPTSSRYQLRT